MKDMPLPETYTSPRNKTDQATGSSAEAPCSAPKLLYAEEHTQKDEYRININAGGKLMIREQGVVVVTFTNGVFERAEFPFNGLYSRNGWRLLAAINAFIEAKEQELKAQNDRGVPRP